MADTTKNLSIEQQEELLTTLRIRFEKNVLRHPGLDWAIVHKALLTKPDKLWSIYEMERTGGEPDVVIEQHIKDGFTFYDCAPESPKGRRSICYDHPALHARKENKPDNSALNMAEAMEVEILTEEQYRYLQEFGNFDTKTSSWVKTPDKIRALGGAIFCDRRYNMVFVYHNGAESYYAARGFRGRLSL